MKITSKYILREHLGPLTFSLGALTSLLLLNYIARKFGDLVGKGLPWEAIAQFFVLSVPFTIAMTLPMAVLVSVLYAFSRLAGENEITAFKASGVSMARLLGPVLWAASLLAVGMILFNDQVLPRANHRLSLLTQSIARTSPTFLLKEQVLNEIGNTGYQLRANKVDQIRHTMREVTIYDLSQTRPRTIHADSGALALMRNGKDLQLTLYHGEIEQLGETRVDQLQRIFFETQLMRVRDVIQSFPSSQTGSSDYKGEREMSICELQRAYLRSRTEWLQAQLEYEIAIADSLKRPKPTSSPKRKVFLGLGRLYCQGLNALQSLGVREAKAQPPATQPVQDSTRRPAPQDTVRPAPPTPPLPTPLPPPATQPTVDSARPLVPTTPPLPVPNAAPVPGAAPGASAADTAAPALAPAAAAPAAPAATATPEPVPPGSTFGASMIQLARLRVSESLSSMNNFDVEIHKKFALAVACVVFVLLGAPIALRFPRGGVGLVIGVSLFVFALYYSFLIAGEELAGRGMLPPWIAMWAANVLFAAAGVPLALRMGRGSGSARGGGFGEWLDNVRYRLRARRGPTAS